MRCTPSHFFVDRDTTYSAQCRRLILSPSDVTCVVQISGYHAIDYLDSTGFGS